MFCLDNYFVFEHKYCIKYYICICISPEWDTIPIIPSTMCPIVEIIIESFRSMFTDLSVVELHGVVSGQRDHQAFLVKLQQGILGILQEQAVVAERGHSDGDLGQEVQVLQHRTLVVEH